MYSCKKCGKEFEKKVSLAAHTTAHGNKIECVVCGKRYLRSGMTGHMKSHDRDVNCPYCGKRVYNGNKFCNQSCAAFFNGKKRGLRERPFHKCKGCDTQTKTGEFCSKICRSNFRYNEYINRWLIGLESGNSGDSVSKYVKRWILNKTNNSCEGVLDNGKRGGWSVINKFTGNYPLCVHHKDGNFRNTVPANIELLCPNCHSLTNNYGSRNSGNGREGRELWRKNKSYNINNTVALA